MSVGYHTHTYQTATQAEAEEGVSDTVAMTPLSTAQAIHARIISIRSWLTQEQWDGVENGTYTQSLSVEIQAAEDEVSAAGGGVIVYPAGLFPVDGYKGSAASFDSARKGGLYVRGGVYHVGVPGKTIWKNIADNWRCLVSIREGTDFGFEGIVFDGDWPTRSAVDVGTDAVPLPQLRQPASLARSRLMPVTYIRLHCNRYLEACSDCDMVN